MKKLDPEPLLHAAINHANQTDEPEHEAGDLQGVVMACFDVMSEAQKREVFLDWRVAELMDQWGWASAGKTP